MAAVIGLTQAVVRALSDATDLHERRNVPLWRPTFPAITRGSRTIDADDEP